MNIERLQKLADYLKLLPEENFDYSCYVHECGTAACAIGHMPHVEPEHWKFNDSYGVTLKDNDTLSIYSGMEWFDITEYQFLDLFVMAKDAPVITKKDIRPHHIATLIERFICTPHV